MWSCKVWFGSIFWYCRISSELCFLRWALYVFCDPHRRQSVVNNVMGFWMILRVFILNDEVEAVTADSLILYKCPRSGSGSAWIIISPLDCITAPTLSFLFPDSMACKETLDQPRLAGVGVYFSSQLLGLKDSRNWILSCMPCLSWQHMTCRSVTLCFWLRCVVEIENAAGRIL